MKSDNLPRQFSSHRSMGLDRCNLLMLLSLILLIFFLFLKLGGSRHGPKEAHHYIFKLKQVVGGFCEVSHNKMASYSQQWTVYEISSRRIPVETTPER